MIEERIILQARQEKFGLNMSAPFVFIFYLHAVFCIFESYKNKHIFLTGL